MLRHPGGGITPAATPVGIRPRRRGPVGPSGPVSLLKPGDEWLHYSDGSHRWVSPDPDDSQPAWDARIRRHLRAHRASPDAGHNRSRPLPPPVLEPWWRTGQREADEPASDG